MFSHNATGQMDTVVDSQEIGNNRRPPTQTSARKKKSNERSSSLLEDHYNIDSLDLKANYLIEKR